METISRWTEPPGPCPYQADHTCEREYLFVSRLDPSEYMAHLLAGWRRFGHTIFRQTCSGPGACRSLRVDAAAFRPDRSQRRTRLANEGVVRLQIATPAITPAKVALFDRFHADRSERRHWPPYEPGDLTDFAASFLMNPFPTQEWCYFLDDALVGVGYVDELPGGLSAIYFVRDPSQDDRSLGTWNVICLLERARALNLPHVYLGYHGDVSASLRYKARFRPFQKLDPTGAWLDESR
jgi:arginyl-tRNA--protein-N-Asp/Glu arginylyltransferase